jgi:MFS family permease
LARDVAAPSTPVQGALSRVYYGYWLVGAAMVAQFVSVGTQSYVIGAFFKPMTTELGWTRSEFTLGRTVAQFVMAFTGFFIGGHVDRHGGRRLMLVGIGILGVSLYTMSFIHELWQWIVINGVIVTVGAAMIGNLVVNVTLSKWFVERRGQAVSFASMGVSMAGVVLPLAMTHIVDGWGWRTAWRVMAIFSTLLMLPAALLMRRAPEDYGLFPDGRTSAQMASGAGSRAAAEYANSMTRKQAVRTVTFYMLVIGFGLFGVTIGVMLLQTIPFMTDAGYSRNTASLMITMSSIPALLSKPLWGYLMDNWDPKKLASLGALLTGLALFVITAAVSSNTDPMVYGGFFLLGCGWGGMIPLQEVIWASYFGRRYLGAVRSAGLPFALVIGAGSPLLVSLYFDHVGNYNGAFLIIGGLNLAAAAMLLFIPKPRASAG